MRPLFRRDSIRARLLIAAAVWLTLALLGAWWVIGGVLDRFVTDRFDAEAQAIADTVIGGTEVDATGAPALLRPPTDPRFALPLSAFAWQLDMADGAPVARSPSLLDLRLNPPFAEFTGGAGLGGPALGGTGMEEDAEPLRVLRRVFTVPGAPAPLAVTVTMPQDDIDAALARVRRPLALALIVLGAGLAAASVVQVGWGLRTLDALGRDIRRVREGRAERITPPPVAELRSVAAEMNALLDENRSVIGRARDHLGNLAHSLKTPMAALSNALPADHPAQALVARMDRQIGWHLRRARNASQPRLLGHSTPVAEAVDDILLVLRRPAEDRGLTISVDCPPAMRFPGERQDLQEMLGNLLENAVKYAATRIEVTARLDADPVTGDRLTLTVADDGPGMADADHATALSRGGRLDEMGGGLSAGLGLAIVADLAQLHGGTLRLGRADLGGLLATLSLPGQQTQSPPG